MLNEGGGTLRNRDLAPNFRCPGERGCEVDVGYFVSSGCFATNDKVLIVQIERAQPSVKRK